MKSPVQRPHWGAQADRAGGHQHTDGETIWLIETSMLAPRRSIQYIRRTGSVQEWTLVVPQMTARQVEMSGHKRVMRVSWEHLVEELVKIGLQLTPPAELSDSDSDQIQNTLFIPRGQAWVGAKGQDITHTSDITHRQTLHRTELRQPRIQPQSAAVPASVTKCNSSNKYIKYIKT